MTEEHVRLAATRRESRERVVTVRRERLAAETRTDLTALGRAAISAEDVRGHVENHIGAAQVPVGVAGPVQVNGDHARGEFSVPFATTEGTLVATYGYGMRAINAAGGATAFVGQQRLDITPVFTAASLTAARQLAETITSWVDDLSAVTATTTRHGRLLEVRPLIIGRRVLVQFCYDTGDAMGMNMVNIAADAACRLIEERTGVPYFLRCNYSSDKKASALGLCRIYGRETHAEVVLPQEVLTATLGVTTEQFLAFITAGSVGALAAGTLGLNAHLANGLAGIYIATGQDVAQIVNASIAIFTAERLGDAVHFALRLPNLVVATVGGGTGLPTQRECLALMGCSGSGRVQAFAEIVAVALLAGEIAICAALANGTFVDAHRRSRTLVPVAQRAN